MPFNFTWLIAIIGGVIAIMIWAKTKRAGPAIAVFGGGIIILVLADPSMLSTLTETAKGLLEDGLNQGLN